mgnify:CR=1 FL=1
MACSSAWSPTIAAGCTPASPSAAIAHALAAEGVTVVAAGRTLAKVEATSADITAAGGTAHALAWDLAEVGAVDARVREAETLAGGGIDILVANAGRQQYFNDIADLTEALAADLDEPALLGRVEELIDFLTAPGA